MRKVVLLLALAALPSMAQFSNARKIYGVPLCPSLSAAPTDNYVLTYSASLGCWTAAAAPGASAGEANTVTSLGGTSLYSSKVGVDLKFKGLAAGSTKLSVTANGSGNTVDLDVVPANISISTLSGYVDPTNAGNISSGTVAAARLGSGTPTASTYLAGNGAWTTLNSSAVGLGNVANVDTTNGSNITSGTVAAARVAILNQNTTGNAATATDLAAGSILSGAKGGTGNGFFAVSGPATALRTFTFPNASATVLTTNAAVTVAQGGTGVSTLTGIVKASGTSAFSAAAAADIVALFNSGTCSGVLKSDGTCSAAGTGDVTAAATFGTDNRLIRSDGTGKGVQSTGITVDDSDNVTFPSGVTINGTLNVGNGTVAGELVMQELTANGSAYVSWLAPDSLTNILRLKFPDATPTDNQSMRFSAPVSNVSTISFVSELADPGANGVVNRSAAGTTTQASATEISAPLFAADAGANDTYTATLSPAPASYVTGTHYRFKANTANTGAASINFNSLGAKAIKKAAGGITTDLADNDIRAGQWVDVVYDGTNMQMQSLLGNAPAGSGTVTSIATTSPITGGTITATGTIGCATCVTSAAALTNGQLVFGAGSQGSAVGNLSGDVTTSGSGVTTVVNLPTGVTQAGSLLATAIVAPATPAAGKGSIYVDSTSKNLSVKDDAGVVKHGVQTKAAVTSNFLTAINDAGAVTAAQPTVADLAASTSADLRGVIGDETGSGVLVFATSPTLVTPTLGVATATSINGTTIPSTATLLTTTSTLANLGSSTSANLAGILSDETGSGAAVFATSPTLVTPTLGVASATSINKVALTAPATGSTLTIADGKTLTASNTLTLTGTDSSSVAFGTGGTVAYEIGAGTATLGTSAISANSCATVVTVSATGVATTDVIIATFNADVSATTGYGAGASDGLVVYPYPTANNVNFKVCNTTGSSITPGAATLNWRVDR